MKSKNVTVFLSLFICFASVRAQEKLYINEFPISDVTLLQGPFKDARDLNIEVLLQYDVDRLLAPYRKVAGLPEKAESYPNWDGLDGHVAGHYLSAMAINYAATGNKTCKERMEYMLSELNACMEANAVPQCRLGYRLFRWLSQQRGIVAGVQERRLWFVPLRMGTFLQFTQDVCRSA